MSTGDPTATRDPEWTIPVRVGVMQLAGLASIGAAAIHAAAAGLHAEFPTLARLFIAVTMAQLAAGLLALVKGGRLAAASVGLVNVVALAAWGATRVWDISWIAGLEQRHAPAFMDTTAAALATVAVGAAAVALARARTGVAEVRLGFPALSIGSVALVAMLVGSTQVHTHDHGIADGSGQAVALQSAPGVVGGIGTDNAAGHSHGHGDGHDPGDGEGGSGGAVGVAAPDSDEPAWPRPWDPAIGVDLTGVPGVTREQEIRAAGLIQRTLRDLPQFADVSTIGEVGYQTIGDARTGYEHYINYAYINDDHILDPNYPESLVYRVDGDQRTLVSAMFIVGGTEIDDPDLVDYGGPLMEWHVHDNLCWIVDDGRPQVVGVTDANGECPIEGSVNAGGDNPMVHVWIVPHECGPFAALEGHGAGQAAGSDAERADLCAHDYGHGDGHGSAQADVGHEPAAAPEPVPFDPSGPIDLSGMPGVTPPQREYAENLVERTIAELPQWADPEVAEAAGFRSIGDGATGHEHYVQWDWINDDVWLDPNHPESLVYEPQPDGTKVLVSAMYMLPESYTLDDVPDFGGPLMQWHIHDDLCFDVAGAAPRVGGLTDAAGTCTAPLVQLGQAPMIHVWIVPNPCGPFAALEGVAAGQVAEGETHLCDHHHGSVVD